MRTPLMLVGIVMFIVGLCLVASYQDVKNSADEMTKSIFSPLDNMNYLEGTSSFDPKKYQQEAFFKVGVFMKDWISFERDFAAGVAVMVAGLGLFLASSLSGERNFWRKTAEFFS
jgi:hypothetical protein